VEGEVGQAVREGGEATDEVVERVAEGGYGAVAYAEVAGEEDPVEAVGAGEGAAGDPGCGVAGGGPEVEGKAVGVDPGEEDQG
jgi:hypothetical protein